MWRRLKRKPRRQSPDRSWLTKGVCALQLWGAKCWYAGQRDEVTWRQQTHLHAGQLCIGDALALGRQLRLSKVLQAGSQGWPAVL